MDFNPGQESLKVCKWGYKEIPCKKKRPIRKNQARQAIEKKKKEQKGDIKKRSGEGETSLIAEIKQGRLDSEDSSVR